MTPDFSKLFQKYEQLLSEVDNVFKRVQGTYADCVRCRINCTECCHAVFELFPIEAIYLNTLFNQHLKRKQRREVLRRAEKAFLEQGKFKERPQDGKGELLWIAEARIRCPLLSDQGHCLLYEFRPITCRLYGIPTAIRGKGHTCPKSGFKKGVVYPTVNLDLIHERLYVLSVELIGLDDYQPASVAARKLVPVSLALKEDVREVAPGLERSV